MCAIEEEELLRRVERIADIQPVEGATERAMARTGDVLAAEPRRPQIPDRVKRRWIMPSSLAAGVAILVGLGLLRWWPAPASAAEMLDHVIAVNRGYRGWVHTWLNHEPPERIVSGRWDTLNGLHQNTADGTEAYVNGNDDGVWIHYASPREQATYSYTGSTNQLVITDIPPSWADRYEQRVARTSVDLQSELDSMAQLTGRRWADIRYSQEGTYQRFDITYFKDEDIETAKRLMREQLISLTVSVVLWVDPDTGLIAREQRRWLGWQAEHEIYETQFTWHKTYGEPGFAKIEDLGLPPDVQVVDRRLKGEVKEVFTRLSQRQERGFGDGVAIRTETWIKDDGTLDDGGEMWLYIFESDRKFIGQYYIRANAKEGDKTRMGAPLIPTLPGWPEPDVQSVLKHLSVKQVARFYIAHGDRAWGGGVDNPFQEPGELDDGLKAWYEQYKSAVVYSFIWPGWRTLQLSAPGAEVLHRQDRPGQLGLRAVQYHGTGFDWALPAELKVSEERTYWFDPSRDDMPVETLFHEFADDGQTLTSESKTSYEAYAQLPDGRWYPTKWRNDHQEHHLQFHPGLKADPRWFEVPEQWRGPHKQKQ